MLNGEAAEGIGPRSLYSNLISTAGRIAPAQGNQGKLRTNQPQLTPAQDCRQKREFRVPRFVSYNQAVTRRPESTVQEGSASFPRQTVGLAKALGVDVPWSPSI